MTDALRRRWYFSGRVLIETARVLDPQFDGAVVALSGAQLEILRNLMMHVNRQSTFVSTYYDRYYLMPTASEWDSLQSIVADLEEKLMGNKNVIWGYSETLYGQVYDSSPSAGEDTLVSPAVGPGEVWVVQGLMAWCGTSDLTRIQIFVTQDNKDMALVVDDPDGADAFVIWSGWVALPEGATIFAHYLGTIESDELWLRWWGYKMEVPV